jgi:hypothetical protein
VGASRCVSPCVIGALGLAFGRWWTLAIPIVVWPIYFLGLVLEWWGYGVGDGWQVGGLTIIAISVTSVAAGVAVRSALRSRRSTLVVLVLGTITIAGAGGAASASGVSTQREGNGLTVKISQSSSPSYRLVLRCDSTPARRRCAAIATLNSRPANERCLQIWGGFGRAVVSGYGRRSVITRSNSCEIARWAKLKALNSVALEHRSWRCHSAALRAGHAAN